LEKDASQNKENEVQWYVTDVIMEKVASQNKENEVHWYVTDVIMYTIIPMLCSG
jgi:hypothetical protein